MGVGGFGPDAPGNAPGTGARRWLVPYGAYLNAVTGRGMSLSHASMNPRTDGKGKPHKWGRFTVIESSGDPRRYPWGLLAFNPIPEARELDSRGRVIEPEPLSLFQAPRIADLFD
jgi:hypothetical protein